MRELTDKERENAIEFAEDIKVVAQDHQFYCALYDDEVRHRDCKHKPPHACPSYIRCQMKDVQRQIDMADAKIIEYGG